MRARTKNGGFVLAATLAMASCTTEQRVGVLIDNAPPAADADVNGDANFEVAPPDDTTPVGGDDASIIPSSDGSIGLPPPAMYFARIAAGKMLPDEATCAARVRRSGKEQRPDNAMYNQTVPSATQAHQITAWGDGHGFDKAAIPFGKRVSGNFTGTTDEILQWAACKWGFDEDFVRADAYQSNGWHQASLSGWTSDMTHCPANGPIRAGMGGTECAGVFSLFGITWVFYQSSWPMIHESTAFAVDYALGLQRVCFEGWATYIKGWAAQSGKPYVPGDEFGCAASFFTGAWYDYTTNQQVTRIRDTLSGKPWLASGN